ncbi:MAG: hypothetical protein ACE37H_09560 [Phycisphaeraceae bacterium]
MRPSCLPVDALDSTTKASMVALLDQHFRGVGVDVFEADLADKTHAVVLRNEHEQLVGFSTFAIYTTAGPTGEDATIVCSGDTIVASTARTSSALPSAWVQAVHLLHEQNDNEDLYWLLITSGYRTYRFLPVFVKDYYPGVGQNTNAGLIAWLHRIAADRWGGQYDASTGIVRLRNAQPLRPRLRDVPDGKRADPHVAFFLERNPGHGDGDELVSLARLNPSNLTPAGLRMLRAQPAHRINTGSLR